MEYHKMIQKEVTSKQQRQNKPLRCDLGR